MKFPAHKASLHLSHNEHKSNYETVEDYVKFRQCDNCWISSQERRKAIIEQDFWTLQWYPDTPVGFNLLLAHDLEELLKYAQACDN